MNEEIITVGEAFPRIKAVEIVLHGVVKLEFYDGYIGIADLRPLMNANSWYHFLREPLEFNKMLSEEYGHHIYWLNEDGIELEIPAEKLKQLSEQQSEIHKLMAV
jgi:hypothetical protein